MRRIWMWGGAIALLVGAGCAPNGGGTYGTPPQQNPLITRFSVYPNPQRPEQGPYGIVAEASGQGPLTFEWHSSGGMLSVASESLPVASPSLAATASNYTSSYTAYLPPSFWGRYEVVLTVRDALGGSFQQVATFDVGPHGTRLVSPQSAIAATPAPGWIYF